jgi:hemerythrin-like domain-containing protein
MKNITEELSNEHQNILRFIDAMLEECENLEKGKKLEKAFFEKAIGFIKNYADRYHHAKEEGILFKVMLENLENMHCNPIPVMLYEHESGRNFVLGMEEGLNENNQEKIIGNAMEYSFLLKEHIFKEDNVLYPMAEEALNDQQKETVLKEYKEVETGEFSKENVQKYLDVIWGEDMVETKTQKS